MNLSTARPIYLTEAGSRALLSWIVAWPTPLDPCCLVAAHNGAGCRTHHWPLATRLPSYYFGFPEGFWEDAT